MPTERYAHSHEAPLVMTGPLVVLAIGATVLGFILAPWFVGERWQAFWRDSIQIAAWNHAVEGWSICRAGGASACATWPAATVFVCYVLASGIGMAPTTFRAGYLFLLNKWYFDSSGILSSVRISRGAPASGRSATCRSSTGFPTNWRVDTTGLHRWCACRPVRSRSMPAMWIGIVALVGLSWCSGETITRPASPFCVDHWLPLGAW